MRRVNLERGLLFSLVPEVLLSYPQLIFTFSTSSGG